MRLIAARRADAKAPLLYLAGEDRAADLVAELAVHGIAAEMAVVYRAVTAPFPPALSGALAAGEIDAVLHFSKRSAENYLAGAAQAGVAGPAIGVRHICLSAQIAEPLMGAGASRIAIAPRPDEAALDCKPGAAAGLIGAAAPFALFAQGGWADSPRSRMADKGTTPEAPQNAEQGAQQSAPAGPRRKKRAAPTIDLTATEMPPPEAASPPPSDTAPPDKAAARAGGSVGVATLAAGVIGAVAVTLILVALWLTGLLPVRYETATSQSQADTKAVDALSQRVSKIEETIKKLPAGDAGMAERLAAADGAMKSLGIALTALNRRGDDIAASVAQARDRADAAVKAVAELRASLQDAAKTSSAGISPAELDALQKRIAALEQSAMATRADIAKASSADIPARLALSAAALREAVMSGAPFAAELAQAKALGADEKVLAPLAPFAATGCPRHRRWRRNCGRCCRLC